MDRLMKWKYVPTLQQLRAPDTRNRAHIHGLYRLKTLIRLLCFYVSFSLGLKRIINVIIRELTLCRVPSLRSHARHSPEWTQIFLFILRSNIRRIVYRFSSRLIRFSESHSDLSTIMSTLMPANDIFSDDMLNIIIHYFFESSFEAKTFGSK